jgi:hypothetical protein
MARDMSDSKAFARQRQFEAPKRDLSVITRFDAVYAPLHGRQGCEPGRGKAEDGTLTVSSVSRKSEVAYSLRDTILPAASPVAAGKASRLGTTAPLRLATGPDSAHIARALDHGSLLLAEQDSTTTLVRGDFAPRVATSVYDQLKVR